MTTFTPAQQTFYDALARVDGKLLLIARQVIEAGLTPRADGKTLTRAALDVVNAVLAAKG